MCGGRRRRHLVPAAVPSSSAGSTSPAAPRSATSATPVRSVACGLTSIRLPPARSVASGIPAAGCTTALVPTTRHRSAFAAREWARSSNARSSISPKSTTSGRRSPPHAAQRGRSSPSGSASARWPQRLHRSREIAPWISMGSAARASRPTSPSCAGRRASRPCAVRSVPPPGPASSRAARVCSPSTFWVMIPGSPRRRKNRAKARCPSFGAHVATRPRRHSYHSHTVRGSRSKAPMLASSSGR